MINYKILKCPVTGIEPATCHSYPSTRHCVRKVVMIIHSQYRLCLPLGFEVLTPGLGSLNIGKSLWDFSLICSAELSMVTSGNFNTVIVFFYRDSFKTCWMNLWYNRYFISYNFKEKKALPTYLPSLGVRSQKYFVYWVISNKCCLLLLFIYYNKNLIFLNENF